ncbi:MAG: hypothetical protein Q4P84_09310, partial [Elusimicrobiales bacterium]|nr:hypothetical protein [Elusimicrobiales bacterium]
KAVEQIQAAVKRKRNFLFITILLQSGLQLQYMVLSSVIQGAFGPVYTGPKDLFPLGSTGMFYYAYGKKSNYFFALVFCARDFRMTVWQEIAANEKLGGK